MSSQASGDNTIRLKYVIDYSGVAPAAAAAGREVEKAAEKSGTAVEAALGKTTAATKETAQQTEQSGRQMRNALQGIEPAISVVTNSMNRLGVEGAGSLGALGGAVTKLFAGGASPIALAVAGATALVGIMSALGSSTDEATEAIRRQADAAEDAARRYEEAAGKFRGLAIDASLRARAQRAGVDPREQAIDEAEETLVRRQQIREDGLAAFAPGTRGDEPDRLRRELEEIKSERRALYWQREDLKIALALETRPPESAEVAAARARSFEQFMGRTRIGTPDIYPTGSALEATLRESGLYAAGLDPRPSLTAEARRAQQARMARIDALSMEGLPAFGSQDTDGPVPGLPRDVYSSAQAVERRAAAERELASIRTGTSRAVLDLESEIAERQAELAEYLRNGSAAQQDVIAARQEEIGALQQTLDLQRQIDEERAPAGRPGVAASTSPLMDSLKFSARDAFTDGLAEAMNDPSNYKSALQGFASSLQSSVTRAMANAVADALLGSGEAGAGPGLFSTLFSATFGAATGGGGGDGAGAAVDGSAAATSGTAGKRSMGTDSRPIVVINAFSERDADAMAQKMSASGAQVVVARANGDGVSRGVVPSRRRG